MITGLLQWTTSYEIKQHGFVLVALFFVLFSIKVNGQNGGSQKASEWLESAKTALQNQKHESAISWAKKAMLACDSANNTQCLASASTLLAQGYEAQEKYGLSLLYYLQAQESYRQLQDANAVFQMDHLIANMYNKWGIYMRAGNYYGVAARSSAAPNWKPLTLMAAQAFEKGKHLDSALYYYQILEQEYSKYPDSSKVEVNLLHSVIGIQNQLGKDSAALLANKRVLELSLSNEDWENVALAYNNLGFLQKKLNQPQKAMESFQQGLTLSKEKSVGQQYKTSYLINLGIISQNLKDYTNALEYMNEALELIENSEEPQPIVKAQIENILANMNLGLKNYYQAKLHNTKAIKLSKHPKAIEERLVALKTAYLMHKELRNYKDALEHFQLYVDLEDSLQAVRKANAALLSEKESLVSQAEQNLSILLIDREIKQMELKQAQLEDEKKQQAYNLLLKEKDLALKAKALEVAKGREHLEQLEKDKVQQALVLAQEQLDTRKKEQEIKALEQEKERQAAILQQKELEEQKKALNLLKVEKELQDQQLEEEVKMRRYGYGFIVLVICILAIIIYSYIQKQKAERILKNQAKEIQVKNLALVEKNDQLVSTEEELRLNMEEIQATQELLENKNKTLEETYEELKYKNTALTDSIRYAETIQAAILPTNADIKSMFNDYMLIYLPKDVVSGDFYWMAKVENQLIVAVVDCTGHGVPGAFMSMIGASLLNDIVKERKVSDPAEVLNLVNRGVRLALRQQTGNNRDGMDMAICFIDQSTLHDRIKVKFCGAKNHLFYYSNDELHRVKGCRKSIGGFIKSKEKEFITTVLELSKGDTLYFPTDGIFDAANEERRPFSSHQFKETIIKHQELPLSQQESKLLKALQDFQGSTPQRDDITVLGVKL